MTNKLRRSDLQNGLDEVKEGAYAVEQAIIDAATDAAEKIKEKVTASLVAAKDNVNGASSYANGKFTSYIAENPWKAIGIAAFSAFCAAKIFK